MGEHRMKMQAAARRQAGERKGKGEEETGEENGRCLFYEVAKTYDIPTKWFPFRVFDFLFPFFLAQLPSPPLSSPFLVFSSPFLPRFQQLFHEKHKLRSRIMAKWHARSRSLISLSTSHHPSKRNRKRKRRGKREKGRRRPGSLSHEHFFTSVIGRPYVSRERRVRACALRNYLRRRKHRAKKADYAHPRGVGYFSRCFSRLETARPGLGILRTNG